MKNKNHKLALSFLWFLKVHVMIRSTIKLLFHICYFCLKTLSIRYISFSIIFIILVWSSSLNTGKESGFWFFRYSEYLFWFYWFYLYLFGNGSEVFIELTYYLKRVFNCFINNLNWCDICCSFFDTLIISLINSHLLNKFSLFSLEVVIKMVYFTFLG